MEISFGGISEPRLSRFALALSKGLFPGAFIALFGGLGAGKTAFTKALARGMGIDDIQSPTFTIVREHSGALPLFHFDAYRLEDEDELYAVGFEDYLSRNGVIVMEWCENVLGALPEERLELHIRGCGSGPRSLRFLSFGRQYDELLERIKC